MADFLPYGRHSIDADDIAAVTKVLEGNTLTCGSKVPELEAALAKYLGGPEVVICSSGTSALHLAAISAGLSSENCAIVPSLTFVATANAVRMTGADVVFADVDPENGLITEQTLKDALSRASKPVRAIMPVQLTGQSPDMGQIRKLADEAGATIITDACHSFGASAVATGMKLGSATHEDYACFSFHPVKAMAMGEGGAIVTRSAEQAKKMRLLRSHDMQKIPKADQPWAYEIKALGYNYRATDMQAALGLSQLSKVDGFLAKRRDFANYYRECLADISPMLRSAKQSGFAHSAWHLYTVLIDFHALGIDRATLMKQLAKQGVGTQVHYIPVSDQPYYKNLYGNQDLPGAKSYYSQVLSLPLFPAMEHTDVDRVVKALRAILL